MKRKVVNREEATRQSSHSPPQVDNANESVEARLGGGYRSPKVAIGGDIRGDRPCTTVRRE